MGNLVINELPQEFKKEDGSVLMALDHVSLKVADKEFVCILGPSGCGKTTLLRLIAGLATARTGSIVLDGEETQPEDRVCLPGILALTLADRDRQYRLWP